MAQWNIKCTNSDNRINISHWVIQNGGGYVAFKMCRKGHKITFRTPFATTKHQNKAKHTAVYWITDHCQSGKNRKKEKTHNFIYQVV